MVGRTALKTIKKAGANSHRPSQHRISHQCQYIRGQKRDNDFGYRERSRGALINDADRLDVDHDCVRFKFTAGSLRLRLLRT